MPDAFLKIGHRGACGHEPENTLASMRKALALGADGFEFDIRLSKDGEPMVIHDDTLERTTNGTGRVCDYTARELQQLDAGNGESIPHLRDVLAMANAHCKLLIELKDEQAGEPVAALLTESPARGWSHTQLYICSFDHTQLAALKRTHPDIRTCALLVGIPVSLAAIAEEAGAWSINPNIHHMNQALVDDAHHRGLRVLVWTANRPAQIERARAFGIDGIISDYPDLL